MVTVKAHFDGKVFVPDEAVHASVGAKAEVRLEGVAEPVPFRRPLGGLEGQIIIHPGFDEPLEDFAEYM